MSQKIYLIGFMGAGKTTVGRQLSQRLGISLLDTDEEFACLHQGMTTGEYITAYGLEKFRPEEQQTLRRVAEMPLDAVIATGGGVPTYGDNLEVMRRSGVVIHLVVPLEVIESRMSASELSRRPLWSTRSREEVRKLYDERMAIYNGAHYCVEGNRPAASIVQDIIQFCQSS